MVGKGAASAKREVFRVLMEHLCGHATSLRLPHHASSICVCANGSCISRHVVIGMTESAWRSTDIMHVRWSRVHSQPAHLLALGPMELCKTEKVSAPKPLVPSRLRPSCPFSPYTLPKWRASSPFDLSASPPPFFSPVLGTEDLFACEHHSTTKMPDH